MHLPDASKTALMERLQSETLAELSGQKIVSVNKADGVKMVREDGSWVLIRPSGTEPLVRCYIEARSEFGVEELKHAVHSLIPDGEDVTH